MHYIIVGADESSDSGESDADYGGSKRKKRKTVPTRKATSTRSGRNSNYYYYCYTIHIVSRITALTSKTLTSFIRSFFLFSLYLDIDYSYDDYVPTRSLRKRGEQKSYNEEESDDQQEEDDLEDDQQYEYDTKDTEGNKPINQSRSFNLPY